ncbi:hypothetical protein [Rhizobium sp. 007]|uniref:hypothetical protein n=1 Tax=Rhizobium sp. 007 TaxID=2785056 RepID=UPI00188E72B0|nr:hypothetical protein [Rhizobium sp. 007]QPB20748.1 hypothetical protein ISN39_04385 [Rhizobium sp. 007]
MMPAIDTKLKIALPEIADDRLFFRETAFIHVARVVQSALVTGQRFDGVATPRSRILWHLESSIFACGHAGVGPAFLRP